VIDVIFKFGSPKRKTHKVHKNNAHIKLSKTYAFGTKNATHIGKNTIKRTMVTKVGILTKDCISNVSYMYWSIKYQNYILNVISRTRY
jgi:hypothetical protein